MTIHVGALAPILSYFVTPIEPEEEGQQAALVERRRYPPPELEIGVVGAAKIAGILFVPLGVIAGIFAVYLNGFRSDIRLDMQRVVNDAIDRHVETERSNFGSLADMLAMKTELDRLRKEHDENTRQIRTNTDLLQRLAQKNGLR